MSQRHPARAPLVVAVILALQVPWYPAGADAPDAALSGVIRDANRAPVEGARLLAANPESGRVLRSEPSSRDGNFALTLEAGTYELAVEADGGLYLVASPMELVAGVNRPLQIAIGVGDADGTAGAAAAEESPRPAPSIWNNSASAGLLVLGLAIVVGVIVKNATDDEINATQN